MRSEWFVPCMRSEWYVRPHTFSQVRTKVLFGRQVCEGLRYIVDKGCLHHAVTLSNVLVKTATICIISSYGITR